MFSLTLALDALPIWQLETLTAALDEHNVTWESWGVQMFDVKGEDERTVRLACDAALQRIGKRTADYEIALF